MKTYKRRVMIIGLWITSVAVSFCAGAFLIYEYYVFGDPVSSVTTNILVSPPVDGPLYSVEDFVRANSDVKAYLSDQQNKPEFHKLHPRFVVVPELSGYTIYSSSGLRGTVFPNDLYESTLKVLKESLGEINVKPMNPHAK
ncbi:MAG: hypothetical protein V4640_05270 [Verrucomicrobiota bacterium]